MRPIDQACRQLSISRRSKHDRRKSSLPAGNVIRQLAGKHRYLAKMYLACGHLFFNFDDYQPIVVYQMGKVGSSSIVASLHALALNRPIYHVHSLSPARIDDRKRIYAQMFKHADVIDLRRVSHLFASRHLYRKIISGAHGKDWKVISLVRDPVAMNVSGFFQIIDYYLPDFSERFQAGTISIDEAIDVFLKAYDHDKPLIWFDVELKPTFGVDVYATGFSPSRGYEIYRGAFFEALVLRLEDVDERADEALKRFLGIERFDLVKTNVSEAKTYNVAYRAFRSSLRLPRSYLDKMYRSKYARHFYTEDEIGRFRARWSA